MFMKDNYCYNPVTSADQRANSTPILWSRGQGTASSMREAASHQITWHFHCGIIEMQEDSMLPGIGRGWNTESEGGNQPKKWHKMALQFFCLEHKLETLWNSWEKYICLCLRVTYDKLGLSCAKLRASLNLSGLNLSFNIWICQF